MARLPSNIVRRGKRYYFRASVNGRDIRLSLGENLADAKRQAVTVRQQLLTPPEIEIEEAAEVVELTLADFAKRWLTEYVGQRRNAAGQELAEQRLEKYLFPALGSEVLTSVTTTQLRTFRTRLEAADLSPQTVRHVLADVRCMFRFALEVGELRESPFKLSIMPGVPENAPRSLTERELALILRASPPACRSTVELAVHTGLRWGELKRLEWRHVVDEPRPHLILEGTKSGKVRRVPLVVQAAELLKRLKDQSQSEFVLEWRPNHSTQFTRSVFLKTGVRWHFHQLRHTFACRWLEAGGSKEVLQKILGHSTIKMTERYGRLSDEAVFAEARELGANSRLQLGTVDGTPRIFEN